MSLHVFVGAEMVTVNQFVHIEPRITISQFVASEAVVRVFMDHITYRDVSLADLRAWLEQRDRENEKVPR